MFTDIPSIVVSSEHPDKTFAICPRWAQLILFSAFPCKTCPYDQVLHKVHLHTNHKFKTRYCTSAYQLLHCLASITKFWAATESDPKTNFSWKQVVAIISFSYWIQSYPSNMDQLQPLIFQQRISWLSAPKHYNYHASCHKAYKELYPVTHTPIVSL